MTIPKKTKGFRWTQLYDEVFQNEDISKMVATHISKGGVLEKFKKPLEKVKKSIDKSVGFATTAFTYAQLMLSNDTFRNTLEAIIGVVSSQPELAPLLEAAYRGTEAVTAVLGDRPYETIEHGIRALNKIDDILKESDVLEGKTSPTQPPDGFRLNDPIEYKKNAIEERTKPHFADPELIFRDVGKKLETNPQNLVSTQDDLQPEQDALQAAELDALEIFGLRKKNDPLPIERKELVIKDTEKKQLSDSTVKFLTAPDEPPDEPNPTSGGRVKTKPPLPPGPNPNRPTAQAEPTEDKSPDLEPPVPDDPDDEQKRANAFPTDPTPVEDIKAEDTQAPVPDPKDPSISAIIEKALKPIFTEKPVGTTKSKKAWLRPSYGNADIVDLGNQRDLLKEAVTTKFLTTFHKFSMDAAFDPSNPLHVWGVRNQALKYASPLDESPQIGTHRHYSKPIDAATVKPVKEYTYRKEPKLKEYVNYNKRPVTNQFSKINDNDSDTYLAEYGAEPVGKKISFGSSFDKPTFRSNTTYNNQYRFGGNLPRSSLWY